MNKCIVHKPDGTTIDVSEHVDRIQSALGVKRDRWPGKLTAEAVEALAGGSTIPAPPRAASSQPPTLREGSGEHRVNTEVIVGHRLQSADWFPDEVGNAIDPEIIVIHYTVSQTKPGVVQTFKARDYLSVHLCIGTDGSVTQMVPFDRLAYHAGESKWNGRPSCNQFSIGIELVNPGPVMKKSSLPSYVDTTGRPWIGGVREARHQNPNCHYDLWAEYSAAQVDACVRVCRALVAAYGIKDIVGHDDISPGRKIDPGPAWDWQSFRGRVFAL